MLASLDRSAWRTHPRYEGQALLVQSHDGFIAFARSFRERIAQLEHGDDLSARQRARLVSRLPALFEEWQGSMKCHERYEEQRLYPFLQRRFGADTAALAGDHGALHELAARCTTALAEITVDGTPAADRFPAAYRAFDDYAGELHRHLREEESLVLPLLLALTPDEFLRYAAASADELGGVGVRRLAAESSTTRDA